MKSGQHNLRTTQFSTWITTVPSFRLHGYDDALQPHLQALYTDIHVFNGVNRPAASSFTCSGGGKYCCNDRSFDVWLQTYHNTASLYIIDLHRLHLFPEGIYRDNLLAIAFGDNLLPIVVIAQNIFDSSIIDIAFVKYFVIADKLSL